MSSVMQEAAFAAPVASTPMHKTRDATVISNGYWVKALKKVGGNTIFTLCGEHG